MIVARRAVRSVAKFAVLGLLFLLVPSAFGAGQPVAASVSDEQRLRELTSRWMAAVAAKDAATLSEIMAPEYTLEMPGALERVGKAEWVRNAIEKEWQNFRYENMRVHVEGTQGIVTSRLYFKVSPIPFTLDSAIVDVWIKRNDQWQIKTRYLAASDFFTKITFIAGVIATAVLFGIATLVVRLLSRRRSRNAHVSAG
jgi:ketosteroid isomerase-like protein